MAKLPDNQNTTLFKIDIIEIYTKKPRGYLGMSSMGGKCLRKDWYGFRWARLDKTHTARTQRIFDVGHYYEEIMINDLENIGIKFIDKQEEYKDSTGHIGGHSDGHIINVPEAPKADHIFEGKTHKASSFKGVVKEGVQKSKVTHYNQMQMYMKYSGCKRALYMAYNKDTSEYYIERAKYDKEYAEDLLRRGHGVVFSEFPPEKAFNKNWFECKNFCSYNLICHHGDEDIAKTCRTCKHVDIGNEGKWYCSLKNDKELSYEEQLRGCISRISLI